MSQEAETAMKVLGPTVLVAILTLTVAWKPWRRGALVTHGHWGAALACGLGACIALVVITDWQVLQLKHRWHWLGPIACASTAMGVCASFLRNRLTAQVAIMTITAIAAALLLQPPQIASHPWAWKCSLAGSAFVIWLCIEPIALRRQGIDLPLIWALLFSAASVLLLRSNQAGFSLFAAALGATGGVAMVIAALNANVTYARGGIVVISSLWPSILLLGWLYNPSEIGIGPFLLLLCAPLTLWIAAWPPIARQTHWIRLIVTLALIFSTVLAALLWAIMQSREVPYEYM